MDRIQRSEQTYTRLFGPRDTTASDPDPELWAILRRLIFGEVFHTGDLDERTRELITVTVLTTMQTLPQLKAHAGAALNVGVTPVQLREAVYQCAPFIGFPKTLNAVAVLNEVFTARGIDLPLPDQGTTTEEDRFEAGRAIQIPISKSNRPNRLNPHQPQTLLTTMASRNSHSKAATRLRMWKATRKRRNSIRRKNSMSASSWALPRPAFGIAWSRARLSTCFFADRVMM